MAVVLPTGWTTFNSGGSDPTLCDTGEPIEIMPVPATLVCATDIKTTELEVIGGVAPFTWATTEGHVEVTGTRTAELTIDNAVDFGTVQIVIESTNFNPCALVAYVIRGRGIFWNDNPEDSNCNGPVPQECFGSLYNCRGELLEGVLDANNVASTFCDPVKEATFLTNTHFDYSKCTPFMEGGGWPAKCEEFNQPDHSLHCGLPACTTGSFNEAVYNPSSNCSVSPGVNVATFLAPSILAYERANAASLTACDTRLDDLKTLGCAPCKLLIGDDIIVTVTDAAGNAVAIEIHVDA